MNWKTVCTSKKEGGLGLRPLRHMNNALLGSGYGGLSRTKIACGEVSFGQNMGVEACGKELSQPKKPFSHQSDIGLALRFYFGMTLACVTDRWQLNLQICIDVLEILKLRLAITWSYL